MFSFGDVFRYIRRMDIYKIANLEFARFGTRRALHQTTRTQVSAFRSQFLWLQFTMTKQQCFPYREETENAAHLEQKRITSSCTRDFVTQHTDGGKKESWEYPVIEGGGSFLPPCIQYPAKEPRPLLYIRS